jgi:hypothetical protein
MSSSTPLRLVTFSSFSHHFSFPKKFINISFFFFYLLSPLAKIKNRGNKVEIVQIRNETIIGLTLGVKKV